MKNIRYAFASVSYHKKISFSIGVCSAIFLFFSTSILNLIDIEKTVFNQVHSYITNSDYLINYQKIMKLYSSMYLAILILGIILIARLFFISLRIKEQDMMKWRIMGFSNRFIIKQSLLENLIPIIAGIFTAAVFLLVCQHTYEFFLIYVRPLISDVTGIRRVSFFSSSVLLENSPNQIANLTNNTHFFTVGVNRLPFATIFRAFLKNCLIILSTSTGMTLLLTYFSSKKSIKVFRT
ncbi:FtsX-like permease family protein [Enterococcus quebecensis]|uniref:ABC3 transporter permease protein domain-containing protein n=1 Tax=Enterococcus quebecensis TaxID=903983 RepID=A0A1E5GQH2_9ENTE|nr:FtsX-like permease family protein [Enterococcus quebecensis]OEG14947.1 hypothetical protein BCR23_11210 [Enterococcus quebecensis]OJG74291.1 hypothetical protein RV12_GL002638 [Enterococcus quebecensis]